MGDELDPFKKALSRGSISSVLAQARASLHNPSRPYTPRDDQRHLFSANDYSNRPSSAYTVDSSNFPQTARGDSTGAFAFTSSAARSKVNTANLPPRSSDARPPTSSGRPPTASYTPTGSAYFPEGAEPVSHDARPTTSSGRPRSSSGSGRPSSGSKATTTPSKSSSTEELARSFAAAVEISPEEQQQSRSSRSSRQAPPTPTSAAAMSPDSEQPPRPSTSSRPSTSRKSSRTEDASPRPATTSSSSTRSSEKVASTDSSPAPTRPPTTSRWRGNEESPERADSSPLPSAKSRTETDPSAPSTTAASTAPEPDPEWQAAKSFLAQLDPANPLPVLLETVGNIFTSIDRLNLMSDSASPTFGSSSLGLGSSVEPSPQQAEEKERRKRVILSRVSKMMDCKDGRLLVRLCKLIFKLSPSGPFLLSTCKLLFKMSKDESNDKLFREENIIEHLLRVLCSKQEVSSEVLVYAAGTLKNISNDAENQKLMSQQGTIAALASLLANTAKSLEAPKSEDTPPESQDMSNYIPPKPSSLGPNADRAGQLLVQITATLRNLAQLSSMSRQFAVFGVVESLAPVLLRLPTHGELALNITRVLSKLSTVEECRSSMDKNEDLIRALLAVLSVHSNNRALVTRVAFILGNLTHKSDANRYIMGTKLRSIPLLLRIFRHYSDSDAEIQSKSPPAAAAPPADVVGESGSGEKSGSDKKKKGAKNDLQEVEDLLTKVIRLLANLATNKELGPEIAAAEEIDHVIAILERKSADSSEELVLNAISIVTNLSFYVTPTNRILRDQLRISQILFPLLLHENPEVVVESARAFGNFSHDRSIRKFMSDKRVDEVMVILLDHGSRDVVFSVSGVLVNLASDPAHKHFFRNSTELEKVLDVIQVSGAEDSTLSSTALKILCNLCTGGDRPFFSTEQIDIVYAVIEALVDKLQDVLESRNDPNADECTEVANVLMNILTEHQEWWRENSKQDLEPI